MLSLTRIDLLDALGKGGFDTGTVKDVPEEALAEILRVCREHHPSRFRESSRSNVYQDLGAFVEWSRRLPRR